MSYIQRHILRNVPFSSKEYTLTWDSNFGAELLNITGDYLLILLLLEYQSISNKNLGCPIY